MDVPDEVLEKACKARRIRGDDRFLVLALLERPESAWPGCCGSGCEPCMEDIMSAAREIREQCGS